MLVSKHEPQSCLSCNDDVKSTRHIPIPLKCPRMKTQTDLLQNLNILKIWPVPSGQMLNSKDEDILLLLN